MTNYFTHLHCHTDASLRDGLGSVSRLVKHAKQEGFFHLAMTDHGTLANAILFTTECKRNNIKPILGLEGYLQLVFRDMTTHITLLADGDEGWKNIVKLNNLAHESDFKSPAFTVKQLFDHKQGLIVLSGCISSPFQSLDFREAEKLALDFKLEFGNKFFMELMFVSDTNTWERPLRLARRLNIKPVVTNDVHFPSKYDKSIHPILTKMKSGYTYNSDELWLKTRDDMVETIVNRGIEEKFAIEIIERTYKIGELIGEVDLQKEPRLPTTSGVVYLFKNKLQKEINAKIKGSIVDYVERMEYEYKIISDMNYLDYFIILEDIVNFAKTNNIKVGAGRGSGAGSLILYLLGITEIDPLKYGLKFERFLNPERSGMPDVDVDFESEKRDLVLQYAKERWGAIPISTYSRYSHKSLIHDLAKQFKISKDIENKVADYGNSSEEFYNLCIEHDNFEESYNAILYQIRHKGKHAGGVIITNETVPIERTGDNDLTASWTEGKFNELSYAGIVKFDLLGLSILSVLRRLQDKFLYETVPLPEFDSKPFELFRTGKLSGIFQFSGSDGIRKLTMEISPTKFEDLIAINALYRPGSLDAGSVDKYSEWRKSPRKIHSIVDPILEETFGAIVYQEQVMEIFRTIVGGTYGQADLARRIIVKSKPDDPVWVAKFANLKNTFISNATKKIGMSFANANGLWGELETHARYSFNKSHSTAYARIAWECAWWKYYYPADFYTEMLNVDKTQEQTYILDAIGEDIEIVPPNIFKPSLEYTTKHNKIFLPLSSIKFLGENSAKQFIKIVNEVIKFTPDYTIDNLMNDVPKNVLRSNVRLNMYLLGMFDDLIPASMSIEEELKVLAIKYKPEMDGWGKIKRSQFALGYVLPNKKLLKWFNEYREMGYTTGIINKVEFRSSKWGDYAVYKLFPNGVFWSRDIMDLQKEEIVAVEVSEKNGKAKSILLYKE